MGKFLDSLGTASFWCAVGMLIMVIANGVWHSPPNYDIHINAAPPMEVQP